MRGNSGGGEFVLLIVLGGAMEADACSSFIELNALTASGVLGTLHVCVPVLRKVLLLECLHSLLLPHLLPSFFLLVQCFA